MINGQGPAPKAATPGDCSLRTGWCPATVRSAQRFRRCSTRWRSRSSAKGTMHLDQVMQPAIELADGFPMYEFLRNYPRSASARRPNSGNGRRRPTIRTAGCRRSAKCSVSRTWRGRCARSPPPTRRRSRRPITAWPRSAPDATRSTPATSRAASPTRTRPPAACSPTTISPSFHGAIEKPATTSFHGYDIYKAGPWNQGPVLLQTLNILEGVDLKAPGANSADYIHTVHEAIKLAYADRNAYYGDPAFATVPMAGLLSKAYAAERRALIGPQASLEQRAGNPFAFDPVVKAPASAYTPHSQGHEDRRQRRRHDLRRRGGQGRQSVQRDAELGVAARRRVHRRRHGRAAVEPDDRVRSRSAQPERAGRRQAAADDADADASC